MLYLIKLIMKKSQIYTGTGDKGKTSLVGGLRVKKNDDRIEAYGTIDELNSFIGLLISEGLNEKDALLLMYVQNKLFTVGSYLATDSSFTEFREASLLDAESITKLENRIDEIDELLPKVKSFILPGGSKTASLAHVCRTICRRAERLIIKTSENIEIDDNILKFINRLSDYLFILSRYCNLLESHSEVLWDKTCK